MAECIEREAAIRALLNDSPEQVSYSREDAADCIRYMDAADVATVRHGRWIGCNGEIVDWDETHGLTFFRFDDAQELIIPKSNIQSAKLYVD